MPVVAIPTLLKILYKAKKTSVAVSNLNKMKKLGTTKQKVVGLTRKEQIKTIYTSDEFRQLRRILDDNELFREHKNRINDLLERTMEFAQSNQYVFITEQEMFNYVLQKDGNANIVLLMETTEVDLYIVEMLIQNELTQYTKTLAQNIGVDLVSILEHNHIATTKCLYAVLKRNVGRKYIKQEDTVMYTFMKWLNKHYLNERVEKIVLRDEAMREFEIKDKVFYARMSYVKKKVMKIDSDNKYYYIGVAKDTWQKENPKQINDELIEKFIKKHKK